MTIKAAIKRMLKCFLKIEYTEEYGQVYLHVKLPVKLNRKKIYRIRHASHPIQKNKIVMDNYMGKAYGCNTKYVAEKLLEMYPGKLDIVWLVSEEDKSINSFPEGIRPVVYSSQQAFREFATAKVWVSNYHKIYFVRRGLYKRPEQRFIQMWHGSLGIKRIENNVQLLTENDNWLVHAKESSNMVTDWISNSTFETQVYYDAFWNVENVLEYGHPRNDILFDIPDYIRKKVEEHFGFHGKKILLYAPTFREDYRINCYMIDWEALASALKQKFGGDWIVLLRLHPRVRQYSKMVINQASCVKDATYYDDIQELLASADCMITDYSSCIFDFMLTRRPGFIFATDIEQFNTERGFYYPLESTPFPIARNNDELLNHIAAFDQEAYSDSVSTFLKEKGCIEDGKASERVARLIAEITGIEEQPDERNSKKV